ncbi:MAG: homoserine dehydrogenase [Candidatus Puniceispirillaceae bacterium]
MSDIRIAIAGLGVVGAEVARHLIANQEQLSQKAGHNLVLTAVSARSKGKDRGVNLDGITWFDNPVALADEDVDIIIELMGGSDGPALALTKAALEQGKHVVTANKAMIAIHGVELAELAEAHNAQLFFESSVAGGIPALKILREGLSANDISAVSGVLNGTCNYILSEMEETGRPFDDVLAEAQALGYAEADPTFDVDGIDAAHKLTILSALAFGTKPDFDSLSITGIRAITASDISYAEELGYRIRLIGRAAKGAPAKVAPVLLKESAQLAKVTGSLNAVHYEAEPVNLVSAIGPGAGAGPTASAVLADIIDISSGRYNFPFGKPVAQLATPDKNQTDDSRSEYYLRLVVADKPGVLASVTDILQNCDISVETLIQKGDGTSDQVDLLMIVHETDHASMAKASNTLASLDAVMAVHQPLAVLA